MPAEALHATDDGATHPVPGLLDRVQIEASASRAAATSAPTRSSQSVSPTTTASTVIAYVSSTSAAACSSAAENRSVGEAVGLYSQLRKLRSWPRASRCTSLTSPALRW